jgi:NAD(P)-dependent dehydrogenase (short-subunit alcohol dehydrogenase family)
MFMARLPACFWNADADDLAHEEQVRGKEGGISQSGQPCLLQVNYLGHWLLVNQLMEEQRRRFSNAGQGTRIIFLSSVTHRAGKDCTIVSTICCLCGSVFP